MNYCKLLVQAKENTQGVEASQTRCYKVDYPPPKKLPRTVSSENIQKFLARRDEEEKQKAHELKEKKEEILTVRAKKEFKARKAKAMLKNAKRASKPVVTSSETPVQCDEDDYGYVSQEATNCYYKLMAKYEEMEKNTSKGSCRPTKPDLSAESHNVNAQNQQKRYENLLKIAEPKHKDRIVVRKPLKEKSPVRPMTQKEKVDHLKEQERKRSFAERHKQQTSDVWRKTSASSRSTLQRKKHTMGGVSSVKAKVAREAHHSSNPNKQRGSQAHPPKHKVEPHHSRQRITQPDPKVQMVKKKRKRIITSDSDDDSDPNGAIVPAGRDTDVSRNRREILVYDKRRYAIISDSEDESKESSLSQLLLKEQNSKKIALIEEREEKKKSRG